MKDFDSTEAVNYWIKTCIQNKGYNIEKQNLTSIKEITIVDTAGDNVGTLSTQVQKADIIIVPFVPHRVDSQIVIKWFDKVVEYERKVKNDITRKIYFLTNRREVDNKTQYKRINNLSKAVSTSKTKAQIVPDTLSLSYKSTFYDSFLDFTKENIFIKKYAWEKYKSENFKIDYLKSKYVKELKETFDFFEKILINSK